MKERMLISIVSIPRGAGRLSKTMEFLDFFDRTIPHPQPIFKSFHASVVPQEFLRKSFVIPFQKPDFWTPLIP